MLKLRASFLLRILLAIGLATAASAAQTKILPVKLQPQEDESWCWAAAFQMIINYADPGNFRSQCDIVERIPPPDGADLRGRCCGNSSMPAACQQGGQLKDSHFEDFGFTAQGTPADQPLPWAEVRNQINAGFPLLDWAGGHMRVIRGYTLTSTGKQRLWILDPYPPRDASGNGGDATWISYKKYKNESYRTFYQIKKKEVPP